jgi:hypothetical protein
VTNDETHDRVAIWHCTFAFELFNVLGMAMMTTDKNTASRADDKRFIWRRSDTGVNISLPAAIKEGVHM